MGLVQAVAQEGRDDRYPRVTEKEILLSNPDVILPTEPYPYTIQHGQKFVKSLTVSKKVLLIDGTLITWHGTRLSKSLQYLPKLPRNLCNVHFKMSHLCFKRRVHSQRNMRASA